MKSLKFILLSCLAIALFVIAFTTGQNTESFLALGVVVTPDVKRGYLAIFVDYIKRNYALSNISEMDLRPFNVRLLNDLKNSATNYKFDPRYGY